MKSDWERIVHNFGSVWNLSHRMGAIDGKHINIVRPFHFDSKHYNYEGKNSTVLLVVCDRNYTFTAINIGVCRSESDVDIMCYSEFGSGLVQNRIELPETKIIANINIKFPYYFVGLLGSSY